SEAAPRHNKLTRPVELLHPEICAVHDVDVSPLVIDGNAPRSIKLAITATLAAPFREIGAVSRVKTLDPVIAGIAHIDDIFLIHRNACRVLKIGGRRTKHAPQLDEVPCVIELLNPAVAGIDDVDIAVLVARQPEGRSAEFSALEKMRAAAGLAPGVHAHIAGGIQQDGVVSGGGDVAAAVLKPDIDGLLPIT